MQCTYLGSRCSCIEQGGGSMCEPSLRHHMIRFDCRINIILVNSNSNPHQHVLRSFHNLPLHLQKVRPLKCFETKVVIVKVSVIDDFTVQTSSILQEPKKGSTNLIIRSLTSISNHYISRTAISRPNFTSRKHVQQSCQPVTFIIIS